MKKIKIVEWTIAMMLIGTVAVCHSVREITDEVKDIVHGYVNQSIAVSIPFDKCYNVESELQANQKFIEFKPTRVGFRSIKNYSLQSIASDISVFDELRNPQRIKHSHLLVFEEYLIIFQRPNLVLIVEEQANGFAIKNRYILTNIDTFDQLNLYKMGKKGLLTIYNKKYIYLLGPVNYKIYTLRQPSTITYLQQSKSNGQFFAIQFMKGLSLYQFLTDQKEARLTKRYDGASVGLSNKFKYITDVSIKFYETEGLIYVLDFQIGLVQLNMTYLAPKAKVIISHKMCESFDSIKRQHFVLLCQNQGFSTVIRTYLEYDSKHKQMRYRKLQPIFLGSYLRHIKATYSYYLIYSFSKMYISWNTRKYGSPQSLAPTSQINFQQLQQLFLYQQNEEHFLFTIEKGILHKYQLSEEKAQLTLKSDIPIVKILKLYLYGNCEDLSIDQIQSEKAQTCKISKNILLKVTEQDQPRQYFSINASIIVILITVFLLMIWICLKKYKGLQRQARRVMENYHKSKMNSQKYAI